MNRSAPTGLLAALPDLACEHCVFAREFGRVQDRVTRLLAQKEDEVRALSRTVLHLRGELLVLRTAVSWAVPAPARLLA